MGHTNSTANIALPQFIGTDKPTWLGDVNGAFGAIDSKIGTIDADIAATDAKADNAVADAASAVSTATSANTTAGNASTTATNALNIANNALTVANNADGHTNQLETKIGLLADLHTTDKTSIVNAINEVADANPSGSVSITADGVKTLSEILDELCAVVDFTKINTNSKYVSGITIASLVFFSNTPKRATFAYAAVSNAGYGIESFTLLESSSTSFECVNGTVSDHALTVPTAGTIFSIEY